ncbi:MAG: CBS domain-containing protein [Woeseiaceae bacterium]|nr:CBS domain-containing protein [Woeseiaceae bacterium]
MKLVKHLLDAKGRRVVAVTPEASVLDAVKLMADEGTGSVVVMDGEELKGIVTERDYARKVIIKGRSSQSTPIADIMTADVKTTTPEATVDSCLETMHALNCRHLPVVEDGKVVAMISSRDLVEAIIADQKEEIEHLEHYISG